MKKMISALLAIFLLAGCGGSGNNPTTSTASPQPSSTADIGTVSDLEQTGLSVISPYGAPSLSLLPVIKDNLANVTTVDGPDPLMAAFVKPEPEYDVIFAATNLGVKLYNADKSKYKLMDVVSWGNLYIVATDEKALEEEGEMACFGQKAVPGLVFTHLYPNVKPNITWYSSVADASAALISKKANVALLAEPAASATIAKAKEKGIDLKIIADLQEKWGGNGYPQAGIFVREDLYNENSEPYQKLATIMKDYLEKNRTPEDLVKDVEACNPEVFGLQKAQIVGKVWDRMNIKVVPAKECEDELNKFLNVFDIDGVDNAIIK